MENMDSYDDELQMLGAVLALFVIFVTTALVYRSNTHVGDTIDSDSSKGGSAAVEDTAHNEGVVADTEDEPVSTKEGGSYVPAADDGAHNEGVLADTEDKPTSTKEDGSRVPAADDGDEACANCGKHGSDTVKLKDCTACRLVKYCGVDCQRAHRKEHKKSCKQRVAELKDERLYSQGLERPEGDFCPICTLPIPLPTSKHSVFNVCCMKRICNGCDMAAQKSGMNEDCPFCRTPHSKTGADMLAMVQTRAAKKDPVAINFLGEKYFFGELGLQMDKRKGVKLWTEAAELGSIDALFHLGNAYDRGEMVQRDDAKAVEFYKKAAMQGDALARHNLGFHEELMGDINSAKRHCLISAKMGLKGSLDTIREMFKGGVATKEQYAQALRGYQDASEEMKSHDRDEAMRLGLNSIYRIGEAMAGKGMAGVDTTH